MATAVTRTELALSMQVFPVGGGNPITFRCTGFSSSFALNRIPFATVTIATGRQTVTGATAAIHGNVDALQGMPRAVVTLQPSGQWSVSENGPGDARWTEAGAQTIFDGYVTGIGIRRSRGRYLVSLQLIHWLADLGFSSIFSNQSHPGNPANLTFNAVYRASQSRSVVGNPAFISGHRHFAELTPAALLADLWLGLGNMFCSIAQEDLVQLGPPGQCGGVANARNDFSLAALARIQGLHDCGTAGTARHVPLALGDLGPDGVLVARAIQQFIGQQSAQAWWATTLWDKLVHDFAAKFMFHIVPLVDTALVVPFVPGLRSTWQKVITTRDTGQIYLTSHVRRPMRGVGIFAGRENRSVPSAAVPVNAAGLAGIGGCFMPNVDRRGVIMLRRAPGWLSSVSDFAVPAAVTTRGGKTAKIATGSATTPIGPIGAGANGTKATVGVSVSTLYGRLAHYVFVTEALRGRTGMLAGKLRFDISPGSTIEIEQEEQFVTAQGLSPDLFASVMGVSIGINADTATAQTIFQLAHIRTREENESDETAVGSHPLYPGAQFLGAPLVEEYLF